MLAKQLSYDLENLVASEALLRSAITAGARQRDPSIVDTLYRRGRVRRELMLYDEALIDFRTALESLGLFGNENYTPPPYINRANIYLETARVHTLRGAIQLARYTLELAEKHASAEDYNNWADIHLERARLYRAEDNHRGAERELEYAMGHISSSNLDADLASIYLELARIQADVDDFDGALFYLRGAHAAARLATFKRLRIEVTMGDVYWLSGDVTSAVRSYQQARATIEQSGYPELPALAEALRFIHERLEIVRGQRHELFADLMDDLLVSVRGYDAQAIHAVVGRVAVLAHAFDDYARARAMLLGADCHVAVALLAHRMLELADPIADEVSHLEEDFARFSVDLPDWQQKILESAI